jgi:hypothetical protein
MRVPCLVVVKSSPRRPDRVEAAFEALPERDGGVFELDVIVGIRD